MKLLVAIPCLNERETIASVIARVPRNVDQVDRVDVLVVDDGSSDDSAERAIGAGALVRSHGYNRGVGVAFQSALAHAMEHRYDALVTIDADGQFAPEDIPQILAPIVAHAADFVTASRFVDPSRIPAMPPLKLWGNRRMAALLTRLTGTKFHDVSCGFRAYSREAILNLNLHGRFTYTQEVFLDLSFKQLRIVEVPVDVKYFADRVSRVANSLTSYAIKTSAIILRVYRDYRPLRFFWGLAAVASTFGVAFAAVLLRHYLKTGGFSGQIWAGFVGGALLFLALALFLIGIVADMLVRQRMNQERILYLLKRGYVRPADATAVAEGAASNDAQ